MFYWLFLLIALILFIISLKVNNWELMAPVPLMLIGLAVADALAIIGRLTWNSYDLSAHVFIIEAVGVLCLFFGAFLAENVNLKSFAFCNRGTHRRDGVWLSTFRSETFPKTWKWVVLGAVVIVAIILQITETLSIANELGMDATSYSQAAKATRQELAVFNSAEGMKMTSGYSLVSRFLSKVMSVIAYVSLFQLAKAIVKQKNKKAIITSSILVFLCCLFSFLNGGRGTFFYYIFAFIIFFFIFKIKNEKEPKVFTLKLLLIGCVLAIVGSVLFWASSALVGRKAGSGLIEYISFYFGCGFPTLQAHLDAGIDSNAIPGTLTFYYIMSIPYKFGLTDIDFPSYSIGWFNLGGHKSNIFTGFARYYLDFGFIGVIILTSISAFIMTLFYRLSKKTMFAPLIILTGYITANCFDFAREEYLFSRFLSTTTITWIVILLIVLLFLQFNKEDFLDKFAHKTKSLKRHHEH